MGGFDVVDDELEWMLFVREMTPFWCWLSLEKLDAVVVDDVGELSGEDEEVDNLMNFFIFERKSTFPPPLATADDDDDDVDVVVVFALL